MTKAGTTGVGIGLAGRPLRFIATMLGGWIVVRVAMLWPSPALSDDPAIDRPAGHVLVHGPSLPSESRVSPASPVADRRVAVGRLRAFAAPSPPRALAALPPLPKEAPRSTVATLALISFEPEQTVAQLEPLPVTFAPIRAALSADVSRWSASLWFLVRAGSGLGAPNGGQLGGDQTGLRVAYAIDTARRVALVGRIATPLAGVGREGAIGVEWQPTKLPVRLVAEQRFAIDGGGGGPSIGLVGGVGPAPIGAGFQIEGYGQAGIIGRQGVIGFGDGALRLTRTIVRAGRVQVDAGAGAWGGIQPGAERLDIGPSLGVIVPIANRSLRLAVDWRERIGGDARPGSGVALSIGSDF